jgi:adenosylmethionine-8-amino-7-oxononanoate aminotransferase
MTGRQVAASANSQANWLKLNNAKHQWHPVQDPKAVAASPPLIIETGDGVYVTDIDGRRYLDCQGGLWCVNAGHGRQEIKDAITAQLDKLQYYTLFPGTTHAPSITLSAKLCEVTAEEEMTKVFFSSGGSDANETALKIARQYWSLVGEPDRSKIFSFKNGYHGLHFGATSAAGIGAYKASFGPLLADFHQAEFPYVYRNPFTQDPEELSGLCAALVERDIEYHSPGKVAAIIAEPVIGSGGVIVPPRSFWPRIRALCDKYGILLIADEVITGLGRAGSILGSRFYGVKPDILCMAKALTNGYVPLGATLVNRRVASAWEREGVPAQFMHGYTYTGHPLACAAGVASLEIAIKEDLAGNAAQVGGYFLDKLIVLQDKYPVIGEARGIGLMHALELVKDRRTKEPFAPDDPLPKALTRFCVEHGVLIRCVGHKLILSPPLTFTRAHVDEAIEVIDRAFEQLPATRM